MQRLRGIPVDEQTLTNKPDPALKGGQIITTPKTPEELERFADRLVDGLQQIVDQVDAQPDVTLQPEFALGLAQVASMLSISKRLGVIEARLRRP
jgi:hypothetical protein